MSRILATVTLLLICLATCARAIDNPTVYVRDQSLPPPVIWHEGDCWVPLATIQKLFADRYKKIRLDDHGSLRVDSHDLGIQVGGQLNGVGLLPLLATCRAMGCEVLVNKPLNIIDVALPAKERLANAKMAEPPVDPMEEKLAERGEQQVLQTMGGLCADAGLNQRVDRIGQLIASKSPRASLHWSFRVVNASAPNAVSVGMGRVFATKGLVQLLDDDELAAVLGHEIAHACLRHSTRAADEVNEAKAYLQAADAARQRQADMKSMPWGEGSTGYAIEMKSLQQEEQEDRQKAAAILARIGKGRLGERVDEEYQADRFGMIYTHDAGFRPEALIQALVKLQKKTESGEQVAAVEGASDHPPMAQRIEIARRVYASYFTQK